MSKKKRIIPFKLCPGSWGLTGKVRKLAEIEYYYGDSEDKEYLLLELDNDKDTPEYIKNKLKLDKKYKKISDYDYEIESLSTKITDKDSKEYLLEKAEIDLKHNVIKDYEYRKEIADINHEAFFEVINGKMERIDGKSTMGFELEWNDYFVNHLINDGWKGATQEDIVNAYFSELCRQMLAEDEFEGSSLVNRERP